MWVAQQMGHADWAMIRRIYGRFMPEVAPEAGGRAEALFGGSGEKALENRNSA
jgi:integrase